MLKDVRTRRNDRDGREDRDGGEENRNDRQNRDEENRHRRQKNRHLFDPVNIKMKITQGQACSDAEKTSLLQNRWVPATADYQYPQSQFQKKQYRYKDQWEKNSTGSATHLKKMQPTVLTV